MELGYPMEGMLSYVVTTNRQEPEIVGKAIRYILPGLLAPLDPGDVQKNVVQLKQSGTGTVSVTLRDQAMKVALPLMPPTIPFALVLKDETSRPDYSKIELVTRPSFLAVVAETEHRIRASIASRIVRVYRPIIHLSHHFLKWMRARPPSLNPELKANGSQLSEKQET